MRRFACAAALFALLVPAAAKASSQGQVIMKSWIGADKCNAAAQKAYPDNTADSLAKREATFRQCLASQNMQMRAPQSPPQQP